MGFCSRLHSESVYALVRDPRERTTYGDSSRIERVTVERLWPHDRLDGPDIEDVGHRLELDNILATMNVKISASACNEPSHGRVVGEEKKPREGPTASGERIDAPVKTESENSILMSKGRPLRLMLVDWMNKVRSINQSSFLVRAMLWH